jgi:hypothetical protein
MITMSCCESSACNGSLCQVTKLRVALPDIKMDGGYLPSEAVCNLLLQDAHLMKGKTSSHSIGVGHNTINILSHVVMDIGVGYGAGIAHHLAHIVAMNKFKIERWQECRERLRILKWKILLEMGQMKDC